MPTKKHTPKKVPLRKQTQREFEITKMQYVHYARQRAVYENWYHKKWSQIDVLIFTFSIVVLFLASIMQHTAGIAVLQFFSVAAIMYIVAGIYFTVLAHRWAIEMVDKKETWTVSKYHSIIEALNNSTLIVFAIQCICVLAFL